MNLTFGTHTHTHVTRLVSFQTTLLSADITVRLRFICSLSLTFDCLKPISPLSSCNFKLFQRQFTEVLALEESISRSERGLF